MTPPPQSPGDKLCILFDTTDTILNILQSEVRKFEKNKIQILRMQSSSKARHGAPSQTGKRNLFESACEVSELCTQLKQWRRQTGAAEGKPHMLHTILLNLSIDDIEARMPKTLLELLDCK